MKKPSNRRSEVRAQARASESPLEQGKQPLQRRELKFLGVFVLVFLALEVLFVVLLAPSLFFQQYLALSAGLAASLLELAGQSASAHGITLSGELGAVTIKRGCDGLQPAALFVSAVVAFPASLRAKLAGALVGVLAILCVNVLRIATLYMLLPLGESSFNAAHTAYWPMAILVVSVGLWMAWARVALKGAV